MRNRPLFIIIGILVISNVFLISKFYRNKNIKNEDFRKEMKFLNRKLKFNNEQLILARKEYKRYDNDKKNLEKKLSKYDLIIIENISNSKLDKKNKDDYYSVVIELNELRIEHWANIRNIATEEQVKKLDSIWSSMKNKIKNQ